MEKNVEKIDKASFYSSCDLLNEGVFRWNIFV